MVVSFSGFKILCDLSQVLKNLYGIFHPTVYYDLYACIGVIFPLPSALLLLLFTFLWIWELLL